MRRFITCILLLLVFSIGFVQAAFTVDGMIYETISDSTVSFYSKYQVNSDSIVIPSKVTYSGKTYTVVSISKSAFSSNDSLTSVTIPSSVTEIGDQAFMYCTNLTSIIMPDSINYIGTYAFLGCSKLSSIKLPNSLKSIGSGAFSGTAWFDMQPDGVLYVGKIAYTYKGNKPAGLKIIIKDGTIGIAEDAFYSLGYGDNSLISITIPNSVKSIGNFAFMGCKGLTSVTIPSSVDFIGNDAFRDCTSLTTATTPFSWCGTNIFLGCTKLTSIIIPSDLTTIKSYAFNELSSVTSVTIPSSISSIGTYAFSNCSALKTVNIPNSVTSIGGLAFSNCIALTTLNLPNSLTSIAGGAFYGCSALTTLNIPTTTAVESGAFNTCTGLVTVTISSGNTTTGGNIFSYCTNIKNIIIPEGTTTIKNNAFSSNFGSVTSIKIPASVKSIGDQAFSGCSGIVSISIPDSVSSIGAYAFSGCSGLKSVTIPNAVTNLGNYSFQNCSNLSSITLPTALSSINDGVFSGCTKLPTVSFPNSLVSLGKSAFGGCTILDLITIPSTVNSIGQSCFSSCQSLKSISIPTSVRTINPSVFSGCTGLTSVHFPDSLSSIGCQAFLGCNGLTSITIPANTSISYNAFQNCKGLVQATTPYAYNSGSIFTGCDNLKSIQIPAGVFSIRDNGFYNCSKLDSISVPSTVQSIGNYAFYGCSNLKKINLPSFVFTIGDYALANCSSLTSINIPSTLQGISNYCFYKCSGLTSVNIPVSIKTINSYAFDGCAGLTSISVNNSFPIDLTQSTTVFNNVNKPTCQLNVPYGTKSRYSAINQWSEFKNIVEKTTGVYVSSDKAELLDSPGSSTTIAVKANVIWTASSSQSWLTVNPTSGSGDNTLTFTVDSTQITSVRKAIVTVSAPDCISQTIEVSQKLSPKTVSISAGGLSTALTANELSSLSTLIVTGTMDARDFKTMRDSMPQLTDLDLNGVSIAAYTGSNGTYANSISYAANVFPQYAFYNMNTGIGKTTLKTIILPSTITAIPVYAFGGCSGLTTLSIPSKVSSIGNYAFYNCTGLSSITIPTSVSTIGSYTFFNCTGLTSIIVNSSYPVDLSNSSYVFYNINIKNCSLYVPYGSKTVYSTVGQWSSFINITENSKGFFLGTNKAKLAFNAGSSITVDLKSNVAWTVSSDQTWLNVSSVSGNGDGKLILTAEANQSSIVRKALVTVSSDSIISQTIEITQNIAPKTIDIKAGGLLSALSADELSSISTLTLTGTMDARDFKTLRDKMPLLTDLDLSGTTISAYKGYAGTNPYDSISVANSIPTCAFFNPVTSIGKATLKTIKLPSTVSSINNYAFRDCVGLTTFTIPATVTSIGSYVFYNCTGLTSVYVASSYPIDLNSSYVSFYNVNMTACTLYVPYKAKTLYSAAYQWSAFTNMVENTQGFMPAGNKIKLPYDKGTSITLDISANVNWTVVSNQPWLTVSPASGSGDSKLTFTVEKNDTTARRYATVTVSSPGFDSQVIIVTQTGSPKTINIAAGGLSTGLTVEELSSTTDLTITGTIDARDFKTMRDLMPELARLDLSGVTISAFPGTGGTYDSSAGYSANVIPVFAFYNYSSNKAKTSLISIKIPSTIKFIGSSAFLGCTGLISIYMNSIYPIDFTNSGDPFYKTNKAGCTLYVPYGTKQFYAAANGWKDFMDIVESTQGFIVGQNTIKFPAASVSKSISIPVKANVAWKAQSNQSWLTISNNDSILTLTAEANPADTIRKARVIVSSPGFDSQTVDITQAAAPRKVTAGGLSSVLTSTELNTMTELALMGTVDARDFKTMRDNMPNLANIDLSAVNVVAYEGLNCDLFDGTTIKKYLANEIPCQAFYMSKKIKSMIMPQTVTSICEYAFGSTSLSSVSFSKSLRSIGIYAFSVCTDLNSISLPDSLTTIGEYAFFGCTNLSGTLRIPSSLKTIRAEAFYNCGGLSGDLIIPSSVDSIGSGSFSDCYKLTSLAINSSNTSIGDYAFNDCSSLTSVTLPNGLIKIDKSVFASCWRLESIDFPSTLKSIGDGAFGGTGLRSISFPATLTAIGVSSFAGTKLTSLVIPTTLTNIGESAFSGCTSLNSIQFPTTFKRISNSLFESCTSLNSVSLPSSLDSIGSSAFSKCSGLTEIILPENVKCMGAYAFSSCTGLKSVHLPAALKIIEAFTFSGCTSLDSINIPSSVTSIRYHTFENCDGLKKVNLPTTLTAFEDGIFYNCKGLTSLSIPSTVKSIGNEVFFYCTGLTKIDFPAGLSIIGENAFDNCTGLTSLVFPPSVTSLNRRAFEFCTSLNSVRLSQNLQNLGEEVFSGCTGIASIDLPQKLTVIGNGCFMGCSALTSIIIPPLITNIGYLVFVNCVNLTSVTLNSNITSLDMYAFSGCGFKTIVLPNTLKIIDYEAFDNCKSLESITIPSSVTKIGENAFTYCSNLKSINIPASVTEIGSGAFTACPALSTIYSYLGTPIDMSFYGDAFWGIDKTTCILYVPIGKKTAYLNRMYWKDFTHIVEMTTAVPALTDENVSIYLDPITGSFRIQGIQGASIISIYDLNGRMLLNKEIQADDIISVSNFPNGLYIVRILTKEGIIEKKILKK
jgi:hypothetical protein